MDKNKLAFVTICFGAEAGILRLQARSVARFVDPSIIGTIYLIIDRFSTPAFIDYLMTKVVPEYGPELRTHIRIIRYEHIVPEHSDKMALVGWHRQQVLKLLACAKAVEEVVVVLDGKNYFTKWVSLPDFINADGRLYAPTQGGAGMERYWDKCLRYWGVDPEQSQEQHPIPVTPFLFWSSKVRSMIDEIDGTQNVPFFHWFVKAAFVCEWYLYIGYLLSKNPDLDSYFARRSTMSSGVWDTKTRELTNGASVDVTITEVRNEPNVCMSAIHHKVLPQLTDEERSKFVKLWADLGLITSEEDQDAQEFLAPNPFPPYSEYGSH